MRLTPSPSTPNWALLEDTQCIFHHLVLGQSTVLTLQLSVMPYLIYIPKFPMLVQISYNSIKLSNVVMRYPFSKEKLN